VRVVKVVVVKMMEVLKMQKKKPLSKKKLLKKKIPKSQLLMTLLTKKKIEILILTVLTLPLIKLTLIPTKMMNLRTIPTNKNNQTQIKAIVTPRIINKVEMTAKIMLAKTMPARIMLKLPPMKNQMKKENQTKKEDHLIMQPMVTEDKLKLMETQIKIVAEEAMLQQIRPMKIPMKIHQAVEVIHQPKVVETLHRVVEKNKNKKQVLLREEVEVIVKTEALHQLNAMQFNWHLLALNQILIL
jgi:hypothetical protein